MDYAKVLIFRNSVLTLLNLFFSFTDSIHSGAFFDISLTNSVPATMDSTSQASPNDIINEFDRFCSCSTLSDIVGCAKDIVDKLMIQLKEKEEQLEEKKQVIEELFANLELEKARAIQVAPGMDAWKTELAIAHKAIAALQMTLWKSFPSPHLYYHIKIKVPGNGGYEYLYTDNRGFLCASAGYDDDQKGYFKFTTDSDETFSIYSKSEGNYLQIETSSFTSAYYIIFRANVDQKSKFALILHPQQDKQQPGILVDFFSLANRGFLSLEVKQPNEVVRMANSVAAPVNKFLILAVGVE